MTAVELRFGCRAIMFGSDSCATQDVGLIGRFKLPYYYVWCGLENLTVVRNELSSYGYVVSSA